MSFEKYKRRKNLKIIQSIFILVASFIFIFLYQNCSSGFDAKSLNPIIASTSTDQSTANGSSLPTPTSKINCASSSGLAQNFSCDSYFNKKVVDISMTPEQKNYSDHIINGLVARGGWGNGNIFQVDMSIDVLEADSSNPIFNLNPNNWLLPDSDSPTSLPAPPDGSTIGFESSSGRICDGGDCHYLVIDKSRRTLYEIYRGESIGNTLTSPGEGSLAAWPFDKIWTDSLRGDGCTSADAAGLSIGGLLFNADEIKAGAINHAIRFILPNNRIACRTYVRPATHGTGPSTCPGSWAPAPISDLTEPPLDNSLNEPGIPYGTRLRLKASFDTSSLSNSAKVVAQTLKNYGMILADGGNIALTAQSDASTKTKYSEIGFTARSLSSLKITDFEVVPPIKPTINLQSNARPTLLGSIIKVQYLDCQRNY